MTIDPEPAGVLGSAAMASQAEHWKQQLTSLRTIADQPEIHASFADGSVLVLRTDSKRLGTNGAPSTLAHQFAAALVPHTGYSITTKGLTFKFADGSAIDMDLKLTPNPDAN